MTTAGVLRHDADGRGARVRVPVEVQIFSSLSEAEAWLDGVTDYGASS
ncbi:MAG: hypothetical protein R3E53_22455 [Myxococcota bacterium]